VPPVVARGRERIEALAGLAAGALGDVVEALHAVGERGVARDLEGVGHRGVPRRERILRDERQRLIAEANGRVVGGGQRTRRHDRRRRILAGRRCAGAGRLRRARRRAAEGRSCRQREHGTNNSSDHWSVSCTERERSGQFL